MMRPMATVRLDYLMTESLLILKIMVLAVSYA